MLNESLVLSVVKDDSSELVKKDQSLDVVVASEKSTLYVSVNGPVWSLLLSSLNSGLKSYTQLVASSTRGISDCLCCSLFEAFWDLGVLSLEEDEAWRSCFSM